ncbi:indole-3-glycerol phosphate synthase [Streptomyces syringium]|uniref:indole-3-glycerol phosphate synthase n=1 Tax=Streptomyces syringium TaxID=76729 RepID=UPI0033ACCB37
MFTSVLMIEQPLSVTDVDFVTTLHDDAMSFVVLMQPRGAEDRLLRAIDDVALGELEQAVHEADEPEGEQAVRPAALALEHSLRLLRDAGSEAVGQIVDGHPLDLLRSVVEQTHADEVIVLTAPHLVEEFFHRDWASRARHKVGVPVLKLYAHNDEDETERKDESRDEGMA